LRIDRRDGTIWVGFHKEETMGLYALAIRHADTVGEIIGSKGAKTTNDTPGRAQLVKLIGTIRSWSIIACVIAVIIAAILWAWGAQSQNAAQATQGKKGIIVAVAAAAIIFAAEYLVNWGADLGNGIQ
jgi:hypothetical protein